MSAQQFKFTWVDPSGLDITDARELVGYNVTDYFTCVIDGATAKDLSSAYKGVDSEGIGLRWTVAHVNTPSQSVASALIEVLSALNAAKASVEAALAASVTGASHVPATRQSAAVRTTSTQVMAVLAQVGEPMTLVDIADAVVALRRDEDEPRKGGGTRYQEICRNAILRLIARGLIRRVEPTSKREMMRFARV